MNQPINQRVVKCDVCELTRAHVHCAECNHALPYSIVYLDQRLPVAGTTLRIFPANFVVMCPGCGDGNLIRVRRTVQ